MTGWRDELEDEPDPADSRDGGAEDEPDPGLDWRDEVDEGWPPPRAGQPVLICRCFCVEEGELEALIAGGADLGEIARRTGATTGCSSCRRSIEAMLAAQRG